MTGWILRSKAGKRGPVLKSRLAETHQCTKEFLTENRNEEKMESSISRNTLGRRFIKGALSVFL